MPISRTDAAHLLRRSGFGVSPSEVDSLTQAAGRSAAVDMVLAVENTPTDPVPTVADANFGEDWWKLTAWWMERMRTSPVGIVEKMTLFWHDHFVSALDKSLSIELSAREHRVFRTHVVGDFHALTQAIAFDPSMLIYLDNWLNVFWGPQENFARELMELFTLGSGNYTETDVAEVSRAFTGHSLATGLREYQFYPWMHDNGTKAIFDLPARDWDGPEVITEILKGSKAEASSRFITAKVFSYLAYPVGPDDATVARIASDFRASGLDVLSLLRSIFNSDEFWSPQARFALVRSPIEWMSAGLKAIGVPAATVLQPTDFTNLGQTPFWHEHVAGWGSNAAWISTGATWSRSAWATRVRWHSFYSGVFAGLESASPAEIATAGFERFGIVDPSDHTRSTVEAWAAKSVADGDAAAIPLNLPTLMLLSPEFQVS